MCTEREVLDEEEITERAGGVFGMMTTRVGWQTDSIWLRWWGSVGLVLWWEKSRRTMWLIGKIPF